MTISLVQMSRRPAASTSTYQGFTTGSGTIVLPDETAVHTYATALNLPGGLEGGVTDPGGNDTYGYVNTTHYTALSQVADEQLGIPGGRYADLLNTYDPRTGALTDAQLSIQGATQPADDTSYGYNAFGQITNQADTRTSSGTTTAVDGEVGSGPGGTGRLRPRPRISRPDGSRSTPGSPASHWLVTGRLRAPGAGRRKDVRPGGREVGQAEVIGLDEQVRSRCSQR